MAFLTVPTEPSTSSGMLASFTSSSSHTTMRHGHGKPATTSYTPASLVLVATLPASNSPRKPGCRAVIYHAVTLPRISWMPMPCWSQ
nr:hypothetical protein [Candidatus Sigynarchaeum springense]